MSLLANQTIMIWKDVEVFLSRRTPQYFQDTTVLNAESRLIVKDAIMLWYLVTWDTLHSFGDQFTKEDSRRWLTAIQQVPLRMLVDSLKSGSHLLIVGDFQNYDAFKQHLRESYPFVGAILAPVKRIIDHWFQTSETDALYLCYSWFLFLSRLNLPGLSDLEEEALSNYLRIEQQILEDGFTSDEMHTLQKWFPRTLRDRQYLIDNYRPQHGPGATSDAGRVLQQKYDFLGTDSRLSILINRVYGCSKPYPREAKSFQRVSKTIFVPKTLWSYRTISMEPASLMWHQKGVRNSLLSLLRKKRSPVLRRYEPENQQPNCDLAWEGSLDGSYATIDLSSASDTVSWALVKKWFFNTSLYPWLLFTRSTSTLLPNGQEIKLRKYAPMGSDLCFPIETIIFVAIVECAIKECGDNPEDSSFRVYGDDIVVEEKYVSHVLARLVQNGFYPNWDKTFSGRQPRGFFRESCGGFFFNGVDITPTRLSRRFSGYSQISVDTPGRIESLIELANDCYSRYPSVRRWCIGVLFETLPQNLLPPFSNDGSVGLFSTQPTNFHLKFKDSATLQTMVYTFGGATTPDRQRRESWEDIRLFEYLRQTHKRPSLTWPEDRVDVDVSPVPRSSWKTKRSPLY